MPINEPPTQDPHNDGRGFFRRAWILWFSTVRQKVNELEDAILNTEANHDNLLNNGGVGSHAAIQAHIDDTSIHFEQGSIDHGNLQGLDDDDHPQYMLEDGTRPFSGILETNSGRNKNLRVLTTGGSISNSDEVIVFNIAVDAVASLPDPVTNSGQVFSIVNRYNSVGFLTFNYAIDGDTSSMLTGGEAVTIISDGTEYLIYE